MLRPALGLAMASPLRAAFRCTQSLPMQAPSRLRCRLPLPLPPSTVRRSFTSIPLRRNVEKGNTPPAEDPIPIQSTVPPVPFWQRLGPLTTAANAYARSQRDRPWATQFFSALVIYLIADLSAQSIGSDDYDPKRTARNLVIGGTSAIPTYYWFLFLSHNFNYASRLLSLGTKILINLAIFTPLFNSYFFGAQAFLSGCSLDAVVDRIVFAVPPSTFNSWKFWPWVTAFSFTFIPVQYRSVFAGIISIGWQTYLAWLNRKAELMSVRAVEPAQILGDADVE